MHAGSAGALELKSDLGDLGDLGDLALLKAAIDGDEEMADDKMEEEGEIPLQESAEPTPEGTSQIDTDIDLPGDEMLQAASSVQFEIAIPELSVEKRSEYSMVYSSVVEQITGVSDFGQDPLQYDVEFTDGRVDSLETADILEYINGEEVLQSYQDTLDMTAADRKRKFAPDEEWDPELGVTAFDAGGLDEEEDDDIISSRRRPSRPIRVLRSREASSRPSHAGDSINSEGEDEDGLTETNQPTRNLRKRKPIQLRLTNMSFNTSLIDQDLDELALDSRQSSEDEDTFMPVVSDLALKKGRPSRAVQRSRRLRKQRENNARLSHRRSGDSDIEFEQPRRSARATRNQMSMQDDAFMDDDSFYVVEEKASTPKIISVREVFQPISADSTFGNDPIGTDVKSERLKDYSVDWRCNDCSSTRSKIHRLVAWRPVRQCNPSPTYGDINEDEREYLIKWQDTSFAHCSWASGAWVFGVSAGTMRSSFAKRALEQNLLKLTSEEAVPDEYITPDIIFNVKSDDLGPLGNTKAEDLANISRVKKILVKFHGLGYDDVKMKERIRLYKNTRFAEVDTQPAGLTRGKLMGYQIEGLNWLLQNYHQSRSVVLADEMGLGKTVQVVGVVTSLVQDTPKCWPFLIVVPNATCANWRREFKQWAPGVRVVAYHGGKEPQDLAYKYELFPNGSGDLRAQVVIMSYDSAQDPRTSSLFKSVSWKGLVVDEGQRLKNDQNLLYTALKSMKIPFRLLLTGTPLQNNKRELFNLLQFIDEKQNAEKLDEEYAVLDKDNLPKLHEKIRPYFLRRTKLGVLKFLPPMAQIILPVTMTVIQEKLSKSIMAKNPQLIRAVFAKSKMNAKDRGSLNNILMQLRKCLCHPFMYSEAIEERHHDPKVLHRNLVEASAKLLLLEIMLPKLKERGHRVLIFSQFLQQLDIVEDFLNGVGYGYRRLDGSISGLEKQRRIDAFNEPGSELFAFLLSTRAGGVGINLATADTVIIMDPDFNPHQDIQALSRAHRIGQKNKVLCFQLMTKDSVEERIMEIGRKKMALDHALIESMDDEELEGADLESILKHGAQALFDEDYQKTAIHYDSTSVDKLLDRSQMEQTAANDDNSAESQFTYARVWANDKLGFEENKEVGEDQAPEPISSSVWDQILAQREEEARREEEANKEVLGRGARRRMAVNYGAKGTDNLAVVGDVAVESSDSSDDFDGANMPESDDDKSDDDMNPANKAVTEAEILSMQDVGSKQRQNLAFPKEQQFDSKQRQALPPSVGSQPTVDVPPQSAPVKGAGLETKPQAIQQPNTPALVYRKGFDSSRRQQTFQHYQQYLQYGGRQPPTAPPQPQPALPAQAPPTGFEYLAMLNTEAQIRVALDTIHRSDKPASMKERHMAALYHRLGQVHLQSGTRQS
ncbi:hypothetical protein TrVFT333_000668 [Trichoderma virens FT-333]|nr:hypothetical protein TrVFT333_000668 [Trichoderma virens FT-333]